MCHEMKAEYYVSQYGSFEGHYNFVTFISINA